MKLLIVDDEELTRTGVISSIDWQSIGIQEVLQNGGTKRTSTTSDHKSCVIKCRHFYFPPNLLSKNILQKNCINHQFDIWLQVFYEGRKQKDCAYLRQQRCQRSTRRSPQGNHNCIQQYICYCCSDIQIFEIILLTVRNNPCISGYPQIGKSCIPCNDSQRNCSRGVCATIQNTHDRRR